MRPVSDRFLRTVRGSHTIAVRARVCATFQTGTNPDGTFITVSDGDVQLDGTADVRSTLDLTTDGTGMWPYGPADLLAPYGNEVFVERGISYGGGAFEWCSLGYFRIQSAEQQSAPNGSIRISGQDRMAGIVAARLPFPVQYAATQTAGGVVADLVGGVYPDATIEWDDDTNTQTLGRALVTEDDRHGFIDDLVTSYGKIWYWDHRGVLVIKDAPDPSTPVFTVDSGANGVLVSMSRTLSSDGVYNAVVASGEGTDTSNPVSAIAVDGNPNSPTYYYGRFGPVPMFYSSPFVTTTEQAASAARAMLAQQLGVPYSLDFTAVPNPALEPWDPVTVRYPRRQELHVLQTVTVPLTTSDALQCGTRAQASPIIEYA